MKRLMSTSATGTNTQMNQDMDEKLSFFDQLQSLAQMSEDEEDANELRAISKKSSPEVQTSSYGRLEVQGANRTLDIGRKIQGIQRTESEPAPVSLQNSVDIKENRKLLPIPRAQQSQITPTVTEEVIFLKTQTCRKQGQDAIKPPRRSVSAPTTTRTNTLLFQNMDNSSLGKRKRKPLPIKLVAEARQIFKGCTFFYIPNDDIAPIRRIRITRARERGVSWIRTWDEDAITHVIVDKGLNYQDILKFLQIPSIPKGIIMVTETYPLDCIQFRAILDPTQRQYQVKGYQQPLLGEHQQMADPQALEGSLQLKPRQSKLDKWDYFPPPTTPSQSDRSTPKNQDVSPSAQRSYDMSRKTSLAQGPEIRPACDLELMDNGLNGPESSYISVNRGNVLGETDALDVMIKEARKWEHLPLDEDDESRPGSREMSPGVDDSGDERRSLAQKKPSEVCQKGSNKSSFQETFSCMKGGTGKTSDSNPNARTISILQEMAEFYTRTHDTWRSIGYRKAVATLRRQATKITTLEEALQLPSIGHRLALKIEEIVSTDRLRRLESARAEPTDCILQKFMNIYGVGISQANKWLQSGYATFEDLRANAHLTENQLLGIEHYDDFLTRIPRDEVSALGKIVKITASAIDPEVEIIIGGSYRRGATTCGDIDCIVTKTKTISSNEIFDFLVKLIYKLTLDKFLVATLAVPRSDAGTKWHGCCVLPGTAKPVWRRIDFLLIPASELGAALIYFTGNDIFNRSIRLLASKKDMRLNQRGLYKDVLRGPRRVKISEGKLVEGADEKKIFAALGVPWRPPEQRIC